MTLCTTAEHPATVSLMNVWDMDTFVTGKNPSTQATALCPTVTVASGSRQSIA